MKKKEMIEVLQERENELYQLYHVFDRFHSEAKREGLDVSKIEFYKSTRTYYRTLWVELNCLLSNMHIKTIREELLEKGIF